MSSCIFCAIIAGTSPGRIVYSDDDVLGFLDIRPVTRGHTLLVPRRLVATWFDATRAEIVRLLDRVAAGMPRALKYAPTWNSSW